MYKRQVEDRKIRDHLKKVHYAAGVAKIDIERAANKVTVSIHTARPGKLIGKGGVGVEAIRADVAKLIGKPVNVNIMEIRNPDANAQLVAENIAAQLETVSYTHLDVYKRQVCFHGRGGPAGGGSGTDLPHDRRLNARAL